MTLLRPIVAALLFVLAGCAGVGGPPSITLSESELQRLAERRFPLERRFLEVLVVGASAPEVQLLVDRKRIALRLDVGVRNRLLGGGWSGRLALSSALRYQAGDRTLRLDQVEVESFTAEGLSLDPQAERVALLVAGQLLEGMSIYTVPEDKIARLQGLGWEPGPIDITARGLVIGAVPVGR